MVGELDLPEDIVEWVAKVYGEHADDVLNNLTSFRATHASFATDRVLRCIVFAVAEEVNRIQKYFDLAKRDWRDVVTAGEYQFPDVRQHDLSKPFEV